LRTVDPERIQLQLRYLIRGKQMRHVPLHSTSACRSMTNAVWNVQWLSPERSKARNPADNRQPSLSVKLPSDDRPKSEG
jgi:hypothetical protein